MFERHRVGRSIEETRNDSPATAPGSTPPRDMVPHRGTDRSPGHAQSGNNSGDYTIKYGNAHSGDTYQQVYESDPGYVDWTIRQTSGNCSEALRHFAEWCQVRRGLEKAPYVRFLFQ